MSSADESLQKAGAHQAARSDPERGSPETRDTLLDAGMRVLSEKSILDVSVADIVREAGVAHGTFYIYFTDKFQMLKDLAELLVEEQSREIYFGDPGQDRDPLSFLNRVFLLGLRFWQERAAVYRAVFQLAMSREDFREFRARLHAPIIERTQAGIEHAMREGNAWPYDARITAATMLWSFELTCVEWFGLDSPIYKEATIEEVARQLASIWYHAIFLPGTGTEPAA